MGHPTRRALGEPLSPAVISSFQIILLHPLGSTLRVIYTDQLRDIAFGITPFFDDGIKQ
jgi:hypothetical protein